MFTRISCSEAVILPSTLLYLKIVLCSKHSSQFVFSVAPTYAEEDALLFRSLYICYPLLHKSSQYRQNGVLCSLDTSSEQVLWWRSYMIKQQRAQDSSSVLSHQCWGVNPWKGRVKRVFMGTEKVWRFVEMRNNKWTLLIRNYCKYSYCERTFKSCYLGRSFNPEFCYRFFV